MSARRQKAVFTGDEAGVGTVIECITAIFPNKINE